MKKLAVLYAVALLLTATLAEAAQYSRVVSCKLKTRQDCPDPNGSGALIGGGLGLAAKRVIFGSNPVGWLIVGGGAVAGHQAEKKTGCISVSYYLIKLKNGMTFESDHAFPVGTKIEIDD